MLRIVILMMGLICSSSLLAATGNEFFPGTQFVIGLSPAAAWPSNNKNQTLALQPDVTNTYTADNNSTAMFSGELFLGLQKAFVSWNQALLVQLGLSVVTTGNAKITGNIWDDANSNFNNSTYSYKIEHTHVALMGRLVGNSVLFLEPYLSGSVGASFNRAYDFSIQTTNATEVAAPPFNSNSTTSFVYTVGVGLQKAISNNFQVALGYEFADWGKTRLGRANGQTINQGLTIDNLYANQLLLSLFYTC